MGGIMCSSNQYEFEGWWFEFHRHCGPHPLTKKGDPMVHIPDTFWPVWERFDKLPDEEKEKHLVYKGGCQRF